MRVERIGLAEWESALPDTGTEVFHRPEALEVLDRHFDGELIPLAGYKGDRVVGLFPAFVTERAVGRAVLSPPPGMAVPRLGPVLNPASPKRRKRERLNREFTTAVLDAVHPNQTVGDALASIGINGVPEPFDGVSTTATLFRVVCNAAYGDPRPFAWDDFTLEPQFTYRLALDGREADDLLDGFSRSLRREIRSGEELDVAVHREGVDGLRAVYEHTRRRYEEQDEALGLGWKYVHDLWTALDERARVYVARENDIYRGGIVVLYSDDTAYFWLGGNRVDVDGVSVNSVLHWRIIRDLIEDPPNESIDGYDLVGANTERISRYKAKFGADLVPYYVIESNGVGISVAKRAYDLARKLDVSGAP